MPLSHSILVFPHKYVSGFPEKDDDRAVQAPAGEVLSYVYPSDAHYVAYSAKVARRLTTALLREPAYCDQAVEAAPEMQLAVFDVDGPDHCATPEWLETQRPHLAALLAAHPGAFVYFTKGGYRIVYALPEPFPLRSQDDADRWTASYRSWLKYLDRAFGIVADPNCADWTHFFRAPYVVRDGVMQQLETIGDSHSLGTWAPELSREDRVRKPQARPQFVAPEPVPVGDLDRPYAKARIQSAVWYLTKEADLSIEGHEGRKMFFRVCCSMMRRFRLPVDLAEDLIDEYYNPRLVAVGTTTWSTERKIFRADRYISEIVDRLESARDTASLFPVCEVITEEQWNILNRVAS